MIKLNLAIGEGDPIEMEFDAVESLCEYLEELRTFDCIWLATDNGETGEILITENLDCLVMAVSDGHFNIHFSHEEDTIYVQEYQSYEDAYAVALDMREVNPRCYAKD
jgi:hypothetical protein